jgi:hypothetical protein
MSNRIALLESLERGDLALFIGADLPREVTGLPCRADLARELARRKRLDTSLSLAEVAQRVARGGNRWDFTAFIRDQLDTTGKSPQPFHRRIVALVQEHEIKTLITTAYDNLLELAFQEANVPINRVVRGSDVSFIDPKRPTLIKLYGDAQQPDTLVVTEDDHYDLGRDRDKEDLLHEVRTVLRRQTVLFLGYNLADPDFNLLWREVLDRAGRFARTAYAVWPDLPEGEVRMWRDRGIVILEEEPLHILERQVNIDLDDQIESPSIETPPPQKTLYLETTVILFAQWLADYTLMAPYRNFTMEKGRIILQSIKPPHSIQSPTTLSMEAFYVRPTENKEVEEAMPIGSAITFRVIPLSSERVEIKVKCRQPAVTDYFYELLTEIRKRWPTKNATSEESINGEKNAEKAPEPLRPSRRERNRLSFKLQLGRLIGLEFEVHAFDTPMGEPHAPTRLPYDPDDLIAILKALPAASLADANLSPAQTDALHKLGLLTNPGLVSDVHAQVGQALYHSLFPKEVNTAFKMAWNQVRAQRGLISLQLRFDEDNVALARYPWELIHDNRRHLLPSGAVELTRYISYPEAPTPLPIKPPLRVLYIESRPTNLSALPTGEEQQTVRTALETLEEKGLIILETPSPPTYNTLIERIDSNQDHVLHFDGHGTVARRCPACGAMNYPHYTVCQQPDCNRSLDDVSPLGYLAFEKERGREVDWVDSKALEYLLYPSQIRVAVLSACRSGEVRGETLFGGVGPALIQAGVPAVIAMQIPITVTAAARFMQGFYGALADLKTLSAAMTSGRRRLFRGREWFIPALYLRSTDDEGQLFIR